MKHWDKMAQSLVEKYDVISIRFNLQFTMSLIFPGIKENGSTKLTFLRATSMHCTVTNSHKTVLGGLLYYRQNSSEAVAWR